MLCTTIRYNVFSINLMWKFIQENCVFEKDKNVFMCFHLLITYIHVIINRYIHVIINRYIYVIINRYIHVIINRYVHVIINRYISQL